SDLRLHGPLPHSLQGGNRSVDPSEEAVQLFGGDRRRRPSAEIDGGHAQSGRCQPLAHRRNLLVKAGEKLLHRTVPSPDRVGGKRAVGAFGGTKGNPDVKAHFGPVQFVEIRQHLPLPKNNLLQKIDFFRNQEVIPFQNSPHLRPRAPLQQQLVHQLGGAHAGQDSPGLNDPGGLLQHLQQGVADRLLQPPAAEAVLPFLHISAVAGRPARLSVPFSQTGGHRHFPRRFLNEKPDRVIPRSGGGFHRFHHFEKQTGNQFTIPIKGRLHPGYTQSLHPSPRPPSGKASRSSFAQNPIHPANR